jgi:hypothetical protein
MKTAEEKVKRVRRFVLWLLAAWVVGLPLLWFGYHFALLFGVISDPASYFNPAVATSNPAPAPFDQAVWDRGHAADRIAMAKWFVESGTLIGQSREELTNRLGQFDHEGEHEGKQQLTWSLGDLDRGGLFIRHMKLLVKVDRTGKVVAAVIYSTD